ASEIRALLEMPGVGREANPASIYAYLRHGLTDHGPSTCFADIFQLPPAHYLRISVDAPGAHELVRYWDVDTEAAEPVSRSQAAEEIRALFLENIDLHLRSEAPVGALLSGGIDSSAIVMAAHHVGRGTSRPAVTTFSYIADEASVSEEKWVDT